MRKVKRVIKLSGYTLISIPSFLLKCKFRLFNRLNSISTINQSNTLRILGNGESLKDKLNSLKNESYNYMVVNRYVLSDSYIQIKPQYYVIADPHFFLHQEGLSIVNAIVEKTTWNMFLFIPAHFKETLSISQKDNISIVPYNTTVFRGSNYIKKKLYNYNLAIPRVQNVIVACIYIAICLKYQRIELYGVEHSWTKYLSVNDANEVCLINPHFFDKEEVEKRTWYEIHHNTVSFHEALRLYALMFESYFELESLAKDKNIKIINCTKDSFIDAFDKSDF